MHFPFLVFLAKFYHKHRSRRNLSVLKIFIRIPSKHDHTTGLLHLDRFESIPF